MKSVDINTLTPCVMSEVLAPKVQAKVGVIVDSKSGDMLINLTPDDDNKFESKNRVLFSLMTEMNEEEFLVTDEEFNFTFDTVISELKKELIKARLNALVDTPEEVEVDF